MYNVAFFLVCTAYSSFSYAMVQQAPPQPFNAPIEVSMGHTVRLRGGATPLSILESERVAKIQDPRKNLKKCLRTSERALKHRAINAIEQDATSELSDYLNSWTSWVLPWDYYHEEVALLLTHAAQKPHAQTENCLALLLQKVRVQDLPQPDCLLKNALDNKHVPLTAYLYKHFPEIARWELIDAITHQQDAHLTTLLQAGVDPNVGVGPHEKEVIAVEESGEVALHHGIQYPLHMAAYRAHYNAVGILLEHGASATLRTRVDNYSPFDIAIRGFEKLDSVTGPDTEDTQQARLFVIRMLLNALPDHEVPCLAYTRARITKLPNKLQTKILQVVQERLMPRPCIMSDDAPRNAHLEQSNEYCFGFTLMGCAWALGLAASLYTNREGLIDEWEKSKMNKKSE
ncbi:MAG: hypothetical protein AB7F19_00270 [Candidatus Babeliales bacterium]